MWVRVFPQKFIYRIWSLVGKKHIERWDYNVTHSSAVLHTFRCSALEVICWKKESVQGFTVHLSSLRPDNAIVSPTHSVCMCVRCMCLCSVIFFHFPAWCLMMSNPHLRLLILHFFSFSRMNFSLSLSLLFHCFARINMYTLCHHFRRDVHKESDSPLRYIRTRYCFVWKRIGSILSCCTLTHSIAQWKTDGKRDFGGKHTPPDHFLSIQFLLPHRCWWSTKKTQGSFESWVSHRQSEFTHHLYYDYDDDDASGVCATDSRRGDVCEKSVSKENRRREKSRVWRISAFHIFFIHFNQRRPDAIPCNRWECFLCQDSADFCWMHSSSLQAGKEFLFVLFEACLSYSCFLPFSFKRDSPSLSSDPLKLEGRRETWGFTYRIVK